MFLSILIIAGILILILLISYFIVVLNARGRTFDKVEDIPHNKVGVFLATSPYTASGVRNSSFDKRIDAAEALYKAGKVDFIIASGGAGINNYDEPRSIRDSLVARGIPADRIILDHDGTRTINSVAKIKEVYKQDKATFISQKYHNERAIYLADRYGIESVGFNAEPSIYPFIRAKNIARDFLARVKMFMELMTGKNIEFKEKDVDVDTLFKTDNTTRDL